MWPSRSFKRADDLRDRLHRIRRRAAIDARMQIVIRALHVNSPYTIPRSPTQMVGSSGANISVSQITAASAFRRAGL